MILREARQLPFAAEQLFGIAADIERYPDFLRGWISARIIASGDHTCVVDRILPAAVDDILEAFAARARQRSGVPRIAATSATPPNV